MVDQSQGFVMFSLTHGPEYHVSQVSSFFHITSNLPMPFKLIFILLYNLMIMLMVLLFLTSVVFVN